MKGIILALLRPVLWHLRRLWLAALLVFFFNLGSLHAQSSDVPSSSRSSTALPPVTVAFDKDAWNELLSTQLGRLLYYELRTQVGDAIQHQIRKAENDTDGSPRIIKDQVKLRPLEGWLKTPVDPRTGKSFSRGGESEGITRQDYYLQQIESALLEAVGPQRRRPEWISESLANWRLVLDELRTLSVSVSYDVAVEPNFKSVDLLLGDPREMTTRVDRSDDLARAHLLTRLNPRAHVKSIEAFVETGRFLYQLPMFPNYNQTWEFDEVRAKVDLSASVDLTRDQPFRAIFGPLETNLGEIRDAQGHVLQPGVPLAEADVDHFLKELLQTSRYQELLNLFYNHEDYDPEMAKRQPFRELPLARKIEAQFVQDARQVLATRKLPLTVWLRKLWNDQIEVEFGVSGIEKTNKRLDELRKNGDLVAVLSSELPLTADPDMRLDIDQQTLAFSFNLPQEMELQWKIDKLYFPQFLFHETSNPLVQKILKAMPTKNMLDSDAYVKIKLKDSDLLPFVMGPPAEDGVDIQVKIPYRYVRPSEFRLPRLESALAEAEKRPGPLRVDLDGRTEVEILRSEIEKLKAELPQLLQGEYPVFLVDEDNLEVDLAGLSTMHITEIEARFAASAAPLKINPFQPGRTITQQSFDQIPQLVDTATSILPQKVLKAIDQGVQDRLQDILKSLKGRVSTIDLKLDYLVKKFELPKDAVKIYWEAEAPPATGLRPVDPMLLSTSYPALYALPAKHRVATTLKLPQTISIDLNNVDTLDADIKNISFDVGTDEPRTVTIHWKVVEDAAGELHVLPTEWNMEQVFKAFEIDEESVKFGDVVVNTRRALEKGWWGRRALDVHSIIDDLTGVRVLSPNLDFPAPESGEELDSTRMSEIQPQILTALREGLDQARPDIIDAILENAVESINGEIKPDLPLDRQLKREQESSIDVVGLLSVFDPERAEAINFLKNMVLPSVDDSDNLKARDREAVLPQLVDTLDSLVSSAEKTVPLSKPFGEWGFGKDGRPVLSQMEEVVESEIREGVQGNRPKLWPRELTNGGFLEASESAVESIRRLVRNILNDNRETVEGAIKPSEILETQVNRGVNEMITKARLGERKPASTPLEPAPIPEKPVPFGLDQLNVVCPVLPSGLDGLTQDDLVLVGIYTQGSSVPPGVIQTLLADTEKRIVGALYPHHVLDEQEPKDLSAEGQKRFNERYGYDAEFRHFPGLAVMDLNFLLDRVVRPAMAEAAKSAEASVRSTQEMANDSFKLDISNPNIRVVDRADGRRSFVADFDIEITQTHIGREGFVNFISKLLGWDIDTTGQAPRRGDLKPGPLRVSLPLNVSLSNRSSERPETSQSPDREGYLLTIQSAVSKELPGRIEGPEASRSFPTRELIKGPLVEQLEKFNLSLPIEQSFGIPGLEDFTELQVGHPNFLTRGERGLVALPFDIKMRDKAAEVPLVIDQEFIVQPDQKFIPYMLGQSDADLYGRAAKAIQAQLPERHQGAQIQFFAPSDGGPTLRWVERAGDQPNQKIRALEYHVSAVVRSEKGAQSASRVELIYDVQSHLEHQSQESEVITRLTHPRFARAPHQNKSDTGDQSLANIIYHLGQKSTRNFIWNKIEKSDLSKVSYR